MYKAHLNEGDKYEDMDHGTCSINFISPNNQLHYQSLMIL